MELRATRQTRALGCRSIRKNRIPPPFETSSAPSWALLAQKPPGLLSPLRPSRRPSAPPSLLCGETVSCCHAELKPPKSHSRRKEHSLFGTLMARIETTGQSRRVPPSQGQERLPALKENAIRRTNQRNVWERLRPTKWPRVR